MLRITFLAILLLTGCENNQVKQDHLKVGQTPPIESPLQNTWEGMAKAEPKNEAEPKNSIGTPAPVTAVSHAGISGATAGSAQAIR
jgi:hypothetical protein